MPFSQLFLLTFQHWKIPNSWRHTRTPYAITTVKQMTMTNISIVSARVGREFQFSRVTITTGERTEFGNLNVHLYRQSYISQVKTQRNLAILKHPDPPGLIWKGGPGCLCRFFRQFLAPKDESRILISFLVHFFFEKSLFFFIFKKRLNKNYISYPGAQVKSWNLT